MRTDVFLQCQLLNVFIQNPADAPVRQDSPPVIYKHILMLIYMVFDHQGRPALGIIAEKRIFTGMPDWHDAVLIAFAMQQDKKNEHAGEINCTLIRRIGEPIINQVISPDEAREAWEYLFSL